MSEKLDELLKQDYFVSEENADDVLRNKLYLEIDSALKLQELVKKRVEERSKENQIFISTDYWSTLNDEMLVLFMKSLLEESQTTEKEEGEAI